MSFPIVLAHGVCPFDFLWNRRTKRDDIDGRRTDKRHYFKGVRTMLESKGYPAYHSRVSWGSGVDRRAEDLKIDIVNILQKTGAQKANIIAHSMGGLDARHMLFNDRKQGKIHKRIASLTTISTPHHGSSFADRGIQHLPFVIPVVRRLGLDVTGLRDLTTHACKAFNHRSDVIAFERACEDSIRFQTYAGKQGPRGMLSAFRLSFGIINKAEGENDGLVSVASAKWRETYFQGILDECDHLNELGWWNPGQLLVGESPRQLLGRIHGFYAGIAAGLP